MPESRAAASPRAGRRPRRPDAGRVGYAGQLTSQVRSDLQTDVPFTAGEKLLPAQLGLRSSHAPMHASAEG